MRVIVYGAGAIGGLIGGRLTEHGHDVVLIARGPHRDAIEADGLRIESPDNSVTVRVPVTDDPSTIAFGKEDVVIVAVKGQDTVGAVRTLAATAPPSITVVCAQNGVENERVALRSFGHVLGMHVMCPANHLVPGVVEAQSAPVSGLLDVGCYPGGVDDTAEVLSSALSASTFSSFAVADIMRWKHRKLLMNLGNAVDAVVEPGDAAAELSQKARDEGVACYRAAGIQPVTEEEDRARRADLLRMRPIEGRRRGGGSSWQSLERGSPTIEVDLLNGEIVLLGRLHDVATPVNAALQAVANRAAREGWPPRSVPAAEVERLAAHHAIGHTVRHVD